MLSQRHKNYHKGDGLLAHPYYRPKKAEADHDERYHQVIHPDCLQWLEPLYSPGKVQKRQDGHIQRFTLV